MARIGYIRVSSSSQKIDRQVENLPGLFKVYTDKLSGKDRDRPGLKALLGSRALSGNLYR